MLLGWKSLQPRQYESLRIGLRSSVKGVKSLVEGQAPDSLKKSIKVKFCQTRERGSNKRQ